MVEIALTTGLAAFMGITAYWRASLLDSVIYSNEANGYRTTNMWFDGDIPKYVFIATDRHANQHSVLSEHPFVSAAIYPPVFLLRKVAHVPTLPAIHLVWAVYAALWTSALWILLRLRGCGSLDAAVFTALGAVSAASMFWFAVPEVFSLGSLTIIVALCIAYAADRTRPTLAAYVLMNLVSMSMTASNWMLGIFAAIRDLPWRRAFTAISGAFFLGWLLWLPEKALFPQATFFLTASGRLTGFFYSPNLQRSSDVVISLFSHTVVMPDLQVAQSPGWQGLTVQLSSPIPGGVIGASAAAAWMALLGTGLVASFKEARQSRVVRLVMLTLGAQLAMNLIFGRETFLYSMHFLPLLLVLVSSITKTRFRGYGLGVALTTVVLVAANNQLHYLEAVNFVSSVARLVATPPG